MGKTYWLTVSSWLKMEVLVLRPNEPPPFPRTAIHGRPFSKGLFGYSIVVVPWACAVAFVLLIGLFRNINLLLLFGYLLLTVPVLNVLTAAMPLRGLCARRRIAGPVYAGVPCEVSVSIAQTHRRARLGVRIEDIGPSHRLTWFANRLEYQAPAFHGRVVLPRRGRYAWGSVVASSGYPFGLAYRRKELAPPEEVIVLPRLGKLHRGLFRRRLWSATADPDRRRRQPRRHPAAQEQFHGLRPFRTGDSPRAIHWRTSARRGEWMVREFEDLPGDNLLLVFDPTLPPLPSLPPPVGEGQGGGPLAFSRKRLEDFEAAVSLAATIAAEWRGDRGGRLIAVVAGEDPEVLDGPSGPAHARRVLERLAVIEPWAPSAPALAALLGRLGGAPSAAVVVVAVGRSRLADALAAALQRPVACLDAAALNQLDFYEPPDNAGQGDKETRGLGARMK